LSDKVGFRDLWLLAFGDEKLIHVQPMRERIKPAIARSIRIPKAEAMATVLIKVKLDWLFGIVPRLDNTKLTAEEKIVRRDYAEHRGSILRDLHGTHAAIDRTDEVQFHRFRVQRAVHREACAG